MDFYKLHFNYKLQIDIDCLYKTVWKMPVNIVYHQIRLIIIRNIIVPGFNEYVKARTSYYCSLSLYCLEKCR